MHIDWEALAERLGCENCGGTHYAQEALAEIIGTEAIKEAIDYYIARGAGSELVRSVLWHIRPKSGMDYCYEIFKHETDLEKRQSAVELLRVVGDQRALRWAPEFLGDPDEEIQAWGAGLIDQLLWSDFVDEDDCAEILEQMRVHENPAVRERFEFIQEFLANRNKDSEQNSSAECE